MFNVFKMSKGHLTSDREHRQSSSDRGFWQVSGEQGYQQLSNDRRYQQLSSDRRYRQLSSHKGECVNENFSASLYAYDNPASANHEVVGVSSPLFKRSQFRTGGGGNSTFVLDPAEPYYSQKQKTTTTSLSSPLTRQAGNYTNYFLQDSSYPVEALKRPTTLEVFF